jgi:hypothetical protein
MTSITRKMALSSPLLAVSDEGSTAIGAVCVEHAHAQVHTNPVMGIVVALVRIAPKTRSFPVALFRQEQRNRPLRTGFTLDSWRRRPDSNR